MNIWSSISSKKFFQSLLDLLRTKDIPEVQMKLLGLIQKWGLNFEDKKSALPNFFSVYNKLRNSNVQFPNDFESNYQIYVSSNTNNNSNRNNNFYENRNDDYDNDNNSGGEDNKEEGETFYYMDSLKNKLKVPNFEHKYRRLVTFLVKMHDNIKIANLLIDSREHSGLKEIINTLREGNNTLIDTISGGRLKDEKLMEITLGTTEDINQTLNRDEDIRNGYNPKKFTSYFVLNNVIPIKGKQRGKSVRQKKYIQRHHDEKFKNFDMDLNGYDKNKYKEKMKGPKNADDIFDLFSPSNLSNEPGYNQPQQPINNFFSSQTQVRGNDTNNNNNNYPQLKNNPMNNIFLQNNNNNNNNIQGGGNNINNNFGRQFSQNNSQQRPTPSNFDILEQKLNTLNLEQNNNNFNFINNNNQQNQFNSNQGGFNNNNMNNNNMNNNNNNNNNNSNLMNMLEQLGPIPQGNSNQLVPYIGTFNNNNNNNNMNRNNFGFGNNQFNNNFNNNNNNNQNNNQFNFNNNNNFNNSNNNNFNNNNQFVGNNNNNQFNNFNTPNNNNNQFNNNNFNNNNNISNNNNNQFNNNFGTKTQMMNNNSQFNNFGNNNNNRSTYMSQVIPNNMSNNNNQTNFNNNNNLGMSQNFNTNNNNNGNFGMGMGGPNNNQQMNLEELEKQRKLKELDDLF